MAMNKFKYTWAELLNLSKNAQETLQAVGWTDRLIAQDVKDLMTGATTKAELLADCLNGVESEETAAGWVEYVDAVSGLRSIDILC